MGISPKRLADGEQVVTSTRTHVKALLRPVMVLILISGVAGFLLPVVPSDPPLLVWLILLLTAAGIAVWVVWPFLNWLSASYTLTNRRLITRQGVFARVGHDIPLHRVHDVSYTYGFLDRVMGCGTLVISAASERGQVVLPDVPDVEALHLTMTDLLWDERGRGSADQGDESTWPDPRRRL